MFIVSVSLDINAIFTEILVKFLESRVAIFSAHTNVIKITIPKKWRTLRKTSCYWAEEYVT